MNNPMKKRKHTKRTSGALGGKAGRGSAKFRASVDYVALGKAGAAAKAKKRAEA